VLIAPRGQDTIARPAVDVFGLRAGIVTSIVIIRKEDRPMPLAAEQKNRIVEDFRRQEGDTGSPEVQIALLTQRIRDISDHLKNHRHDFHTRRGLVMLVSKRNRLLKYLARTNRPRYLDTIRRLGLRK